MRDYTGKLNKHKDYIKVLEKLELKTKYIEVVVIDEKKTNDLVDKFKDTIDSVMFYTNMEFNTYDRRNY